MSIIAVMLWPLLISHPMEGRRLSWKGIRFVKQPASVTCKDFTRKVFGWCSSAHDEHRWIGPKTENRRDTGSCMWMFSTFGVI